MDVFSAIYTRQSIGKVRPDPVPREVIEKLLSAAVQAPNHYKVRPWRFFVLTGEARSRLGEVMAQALKNRQPACIEEALAAERAKPLRAPLLIAVSVEQVADPRAIEIENVCAAAAAVQNMLLAAAALGLGAKWRTGAAAEDPLVKAFFGLAPEQHLIGFIYLGYPLGTPVPPQRPSFEDRTTWMES